MSMDASRFEILFNGTYHWRLNSDGEILFTSGNFASFTLAQADAAAAKATLQAAVAAPGPGIVSIVTASAIVEAATAPIVNMSAGVILDQ